MFHKPGHDLLQPDGTYIGSEYQPDDACTEELEVRSALDQDRATQEAASSGPAVVVPVTPAADSTAGQEESKDDGRCDNEPEGVEIKDFLCR